MSNESKTISRQEVLDALTATAMVCLASTLMDDYLKGAKQMAVSLLIDLPDCNLTEAEALADAAIAKARGTT